MDHDEAAALLTNLRALLRASEEGGVVATLAAEILAEARVGFSVWVDRVQESIEAGSAVVVSRDWLTCGVLLGLFDMDVVDDDDGEDDSLDLGALDIDDVDGLLW